LHARDEMSPKEDDISEKELFEAILNGEIIEDGYTLIKYKNTG